jgi:hypothetical protein
MEKVSVNKGLLIGVVAVAAASLLAVAFLLGRSSGSGIPSGPPPARELSGVVASPASAPRALDQPMPMPTPVEAFITEPVQASPVPRFAPSAPEQRAATQESPGLAPAPAAGEPLRAGSDPARSAVAAYFDAVDRIQPAQVNGNAEAVASEMATALARGDSSDLDRMIRDTEAAKARLAALAPPASCAAHHHESLGSLDDALEMLRSMKTAMESPDPVAQLAAVAARATALRTRAEDLQREEQALRQRYGLTR